MAISSLAHGGGNGGGRDDGGGDGGGGDGDGGDGGHVMGGTNSRNDPGDAQPGGAQHTPSSTSKLSREGLLSRKSAGSSFRLLSCMDLSRRQKAEELLGCHARHYA